MMYLLERIKDCHDWPKGIRIWATHPCKGWRIIEKIKRVILREAETMQVWFVLEANNVDNDILMSQPFYSEEQAKEHLLALYDGAVRVIGEENVINAYHDDSAYSILTDYNDYYYGVVKSMSIKEG